ncbi:MAG: trigger factor [Pseudomonadota bacterium]
MQVTETSSEGLKRELQVVLPAADLSARRDKRLDEIKGTVQLKGFRKGKVPATHLKKVFGKSLMAEILQQAIEETTQKALEERNERPALQPKIDLPEDQQVIDSVIDGETDLEFSMEYEILPEFELADFSKLEITKLTADVEDAAVDKAVGELAERSTSYEATDGRVAEDGDRVKIDFVGTIDGEAFEGGSAEGIDLILGQGNFIPGFEDQLVGAKAGDEKTVEVTFPDDYGAEHLKGKPASFAVKVQEVGAPTVPEVTDDFAKTLGAEDVSKLREALKTQIESEYAQVSRAKMKREILDRLDEAHDFALPPTLLEQEFDSMWGELQKRMEQTGKSFEDEGKSEDEMRAEYKTLAERRVRLGLVIGQIGDKANIEVSQDELRRALMDQTRRFPGQEKFVYEYYEKTPGAINELRAPIYEDKVVDYITALAKPTEKKVSVDELTAADDEDDDAGSGAAASPA